MKDILKRLTPYFKFLIAIILIEYAVCGHFGYGFMGDLMDGFTRNFSENFNSWSSCSSSFVNNFKINKNNVYDVSNTSLIDKEIMLGSNAEYSLEVLDLCIYNSPCVVINLNSTSKKDEKFSIIINSNKDLFNTLEIKVDEKNKKISIGNNDKTYKVSKLEINVNVPINKINCNGAININGKVDSVDNFSLICDGAITTSLDLNIPKLVNITCNGATYTNLKGTANKIVCDLDGANDLCTNNLKVHDCELKMDGTGSASIFADNLFDVKVSGVCNVTYTGQPKTVNSVVDWLSRIRKK